MPQQKDTDANELPSWCLIAAIAVMLVVFIIMISAPRDKDEIPLEHTLMLQAIATSSLARPLPSQPRRLL